MITIPIVETPFFRETVTLSGTEYVLDFQYNQREDRWYLSLYDVDGLPIYVGRKIVPSVPLFRKCADPRAPIGALIAQTLTADDTAPGLDELGTTKRVSLVYYEPGELA